MATVFVILFMLLFMFVYWGWPSEEKRVRNVLSEAAEAVEDEDLLELSNIFTDDFTDDSGITREDWELIVRTGFKVYDDIEIRVSAVEIDIAEDQATITFNASAQGTYVPSLFKGGMPQVDQGSAANVALLLEKRDGDWVVIKAERLPLHFIPNEAMELLR